MNQTEAVTARERRSWAKRGQPAAVSPGFTLLEVLVSVAILAIALTALLSSQSHSLLLGAEARFNTTAAFLAEELLARYESGAVEFADDQGDFGPDYPGYSWQVEVREADFAEFLSLGDLEEPLNRLDLTIGLGSDRFSYQVSFYGRPGTEP